MSYVLATAVSTVILVYECILRTFLLIVAKADLCIGAELAFAKSRVDFNGIRYARAM